MNSFIAKISDLLFAASKPQNLIVVLLTICLSGISSYATPCSLTCAPAIFSEIAAARAITVKALPAQAAQAAINSLAGNESAFDSCCGSMSENSETMDCCKTPAGVHDLLSTAFFNLELELGELVAVTSVLNSFQAAQKLEELCRVSALLQPPLLAAASIKLYILNRSLLI